MESLVPVLVSGRDVAVGISGFGSARVGPSRWVDLGALTGRTTFRLAYDAQELPEASLAGAGELAERWDAALAGAEVASEYLAVWIGRWARSGRKVLLAGFSLGARVAWRAVEKADRADRSVVEVLLVSGALPNESETWAAADDAASVVNVYSRSDLVLRWLYPPAVPGETPVAAGLGPLSSGSPRVLNVDMTDRIGSDHGWASRNLPSILRVALGVGRSARGGDLPRVPRRRRSLDDAALARLYSWVHCVPDLWDSLGRAEDGDLDAEAEMARVDAWSLREGRYLPLVDAGQAAAVLLVPGRSRDSDSVRARSLAQIEGLVRTWMDGTYSGSGGR